jgi:hypothetical protein
MSDLFGTGRHWLSTQPLPADERSSVHALPRQLDFHGAELAVVDKQLAVEARTDPVVARLMTIPGVDAIAGVAIVAAIGDFHRFADADRLVAYVGLNPKVRQSGNSAPVHGRISKAGRAQVRGVLVEAAWSASRPPGPLRAFYHRIKARRGFQTAVVATARKLTVLAWHLVTKDQDYAFARPSLVSHKRRKLELVAGAPSRRGNHRIPGAAYNDKQRRNQEKEIAEQAEARPERRRGQDAAPCWTNDLDHAEHRHILKAGGTTPTRRITSSNRCPRAGRLASNRRSPDDLHYDTRARS